MADEPVAGDAPAPQPPDVQAALAQRDAKIADMEGRLGQALDSLDALARGGGGQQQPMQGGARVPAGQIPDAIRRQILANGMSEADLDLNAPLIVPIVATYLGTAANEVLGIIQELRDDLRIVRMPRDRTDDGKPTFEHFDTLERDIIKIREKAKKEGRYLSPEQAYHVAVATNFERLRGTPQAATRGSDVAATGSLRTMRAAEPAEPKSTASARDLSTMSREERRKFFEANAETPVAPTR